MQDDEEERFTARDYARLTDAYWLDAPHCPDGLCACPLDHDEPSDLAGLLRLIMLGVAAGTIVLSVAYAVT